MKNSFFFFLSSTLMGIDADMVTHVIGITNDSLENIINRINTVSKIAEKNWDEYYYFVPEMINKYGYSEGVEIGIAFGAHSYRILSNTKLKKLWGIDPYIPNLYTSLVGKEEHDVWYYWVLDRLLIFGDRFELIRDYSNNATVKFEKESLDFIFIDGDHGYEGVQNDLDNWVPKVKKNGLVCGDDYNTMFPGVPRAVNEFVGKNGYELNLICHSRVWWFIKK